MQGEERSSMAPLQGWAGKMKFHNDMCSEVTKSIQKFAKIKNEGIGQQVISLKENFGFQQLQELKKDLVEIEKKYINTFLEDKNG
jgi:septum formation topological specificity factor MinE